MPAVRKVNLGEKLALFGDLWSPRIVGQVNDTHIKLVKLQGEFVWHQHELEDELFLVLTGRLTIRLRDGDINLEPGEFVIIPHGVEHMPVAAEEVHILLVEPKATVNTGDAGGERTVEPAWI
jgi:mannose-6-phosphate isomerase-like protein (cupin superfamily)